MRVFLYPKTKDSIFSTLRSYQLSAVVVTLGAPADADHNDGVVVFTLADGGLMVEASVDGEKFKYTAK